MVNDNAAGPAADSRSITHVNALPLVSAQPAGTAVTVAADGVIDTWIDTEVASDGPLFITLAVNTPDWPAVSVGASPNFVVKLICATIGSRAVVELLPPTTSSSGMPWTVAANAS